ncbi:MAG: class I SAM-dependent methyltransferase [Thermochromatium sp.]
MRPQDRDRFRLYQCAVQNPVAELDIVDRIFQQRYGRPARTLCEDFCGTAAICAEWVRRRPDNWAWGVDLDLEALDWGRGRHLQSLTAEQRARIRLIHGDVLSAATPVTEIVLALNFSYWLLHTRADLLAYFQRVRARLAETGLLVLDTYGGPESLRLGSETRRVRDPLGEDFDYIWERADYDPISGRQICHIHFRFDDGSSLEHAFSYDWRLWTLPEIRELLKAADFSRVQVYWQGWDAEGTPDGQFVPVERGEPDEAWIAYISAEP